MEVKFSDALDFPGDALAWVKSEARKGTSELGFVPWPRVVHDAAKGRVCVGLRNGDLVAWALLGAPRVERAITQLWVRRDARRVYHASQVVQAIAVRSAGAGCVALRARCATDIAADRLWPALGFRLVSTKKGGRERGRLVSTWVLGVGGLFSFSPDDFDCEEQSVFGRLVCVRGVSDGFGD